MRARLPRRGECRGDGAHRPGSPVIRGAAVPRSHRAALVSHPPSCCEPTVPSSARPAALPRVAGHPHSVATPRAGIPGALGQRAHAVTGLLPGPLPADPLDGGRVFQARPPIFHLRIGDANAAADLVKAHHYSKRAAGNVQLAAVWHADGGLFGDYGEAVAAVTFSIPPTRWAEEVWELSRLVRVPDFKAALTGLIAQACKAAKAAGAHLLVSFADRTAGHHGGIYQAASWNYHGERSPAMDGCTIAGRFVPGRTCNSTWGTRSPAKLRAKGIEAEPHYDAGKHLYWRALTKEGAARATRLGLVSTPYPKPVFCLDNVPRVSPFHRLILSHVERKAR